MPTSRAKKEEQVALLTRRFQTAQSAVFVGYGGMSVADLSTVRRELRGAGSHFMVAKNNLIKIALDNVGLTLEVDGRDYGHLLTGLTAVAFGYDAPNAPAETLLKMAEKYPQLVMKGGLYGTMPVEGVAGVERISKMRTKLDALADVVRIVSAANALRPVVTVAKGGPVRVRTVASTAIGKLQALKYVIESDQAG